MLSDAVQPKGRLDRAAYVSARALGATMLEALQTAGSRVSSRGAASRQGGRIESEPGVADAIEQERAALRAKLSSDLETAWRGWARWARDVIEGRIPATNRDRIEIGGLLGRTQSAFVERRVVEQEHRVSFRGILRKPLDREAIEARAAQSAGLPPIASAGDGT